jgi:tetratricopeptide (TPR) repeat protein
MNSLEIPEVELHKLPWNFLHKITFQFLEMGTHMVRRATATTVLALFFVGGGSALHAQTLQDYVSLCVEPNPGTRIQACTELLGDSRMADVNLTDVYNNRGLAYSELGQYSFAIADFDRAITALPSNAVAYSNRGVVYDNLGKPQRAIEDFDNAIKFDPKNASSYNNRCYVRSEIGDPQDAVGDCEQALRLAPGDAKMLDTLGYVHLRLGDYSQAVEAYNAALKASPNLAESLYGRGVAKGKLGDPQGNIDIVSAIKLDRTIEKRMEKMGVTPEALSRATTFALR